jgi:hypothetical protein
MQNYTQTDFKRNFQIAFSNTATTLVDVGVDSLGDKFKGCVTFLKLLIFCVVSFKILDCTLHIHCIITFANYTADNDY